MKVVLFCGGYGMRMRCCHGEGLPKPLQPVGDLPLVVHVMSHYASFGHTDFVLCLGYAADQVRETVAQVVARYPRARLWNIEYVDTGLKTPIGERLWRVRHLIADQPMFLANYADVFTDASIDAMVARMNASPDAAAMMLAVRPQASFHVLDVRDGDAVAGFHSVSALPLHENGGYLVLRQAVFNHLGRGRDLDDAFNALAPSGRVLAFKHDGFWMPADTFKERAVLDEMYESGNAPWARSLAMVS